MSAGMSGGMAGSPIPVGEKVVFFQCTSTTGGACLMRSSGKLAADPLAVVAGAKFCWSALPAVKVVSFPLCFACLFYTLYIPGQ